MNHREKMDRAMSIFDRCIDILDAKGRDYSGTEDAMSNFKDFGWKGIIVRLGDKFHRLKNLTKAEEVAVKDEAIEDTLMDMLNYCVLALIQKQSEEAVAELHKQFEPVRAQANTYQRYHTTMNAVLRDMIDTTQQDLFAEEKKELDKHSPMCHCYNCRTNK